MRNIACIVMIFFIGCINTLLIGCGKSDTPHDTPPPLEPMVSGIAATGAPITYANISIIDAKGITTTTVSDANGYFSVPASAVMPPAILKVSLQDGRYLFSILPPEVSQGQASTVNITPLTNAILSSYAQRVGLTDTTLTPNQIDPSTLNRAVSDIHTLVDAAIRAQGIDPLRINLLTTPFTPNGTGLDRVLDAISFQRDTQGNIVLYPKQMNISGDESPPPLVPLSTQNPLSATAASSLPNSLTTSMLLKWTTRMNTCMQLEVEQRAASSACTGIYALSYFNNGVNFPTNFFSATGEKNSVNAVFAPPQLLSIVNQEGTQKANVRISWFQPKTGTMHHVYTVFQDMSHAEALQNNIASATESTWWLYGNQNPYELRISPSVSFTTNLNPNTQNKLPSHIAYGVKIMINRHVMRNKKWVDNEIIAARVQGAGLPTAGVVLSPVNPQSSDSAYLGLLNKSGDIPERLTYAPSDNNTFYITATPAQQGADNTSIASWWSVMANHPISAASYADTLREEFSSMVAQSVYRVTLYLQDGTHTTYPIRLSGNFINPKNALVWPTFTNTDQLANTLQTPYAELDYSWSPLNTTVPVDAAYVFAVAPSLPTCSTGRKQVWSISKPVQANTPTMQFKAPPTNACLSDVFPANTAQAVKYIGLKGEQDGALFYTALTWMN